jgi:DNA-binding NarL/FixJ family response regulator
LLPFDLHRASLVFRGGKKLPKQKMLRSDEDKLTRREREILSLLAQGCFYKEIAAQLSISPSTVRAHLHAVYCKLAVKSRTQAVVRFLGR